MSFLNDASEQLDYTSVTVLPTYTSVTNPTILINDEGTNGIYNSTTNSIIFFTSSTTAFTIDTNQCLYGNGTGLTNIGYTNVINKPTNFPSDWNSTIINKPSNFPSDWNSTIINKPDLTVYSTNTNLNNLSSISILGINNLNATSTSLFNKTNFTNLYVSGASTLLSSLNVAGIINGSGTALTNLNYNAIINAPSLSYYASNAKVDSLSTTSILSINNLNATSTTIFNNINSLSSASTLSINNLNATSTTIFNNLNSLSSASTLSINNLNATSTSILGLVNGHTTQISNLNATSTTIFNKTNFTNLLVSGASTISSSLNVVGNIIGSGTALTNLNYNAITNPPTIVNLNVPATFVSTLNVSGNTTLNNVTTINSSLTVSGLSLLNRIATYNNTLPNLTSVNNATTHSMISIFPGVNGQQGALTADIYNIYLSSFAYGSSLSGPQPYITVNCTTLYNGSNTKLTLQAYGNATGGSYGSKIIVNGGSAGGGNISFINDSTTTCEINSSGLYVNGGILNLNAADYNIAGQRGIIFRSDYNTPNNNNYNCSILTYDHNGDTFADGLSINGFDGISFCTGGNTRVERMRIDINGNVNINNNLTVNGKITLKNDLWHITNDNINRFYFAANGTTFISGGGTSSTDNALIVYASGTFNYATILSILNNGNVGMGGISNSAYKLHVNGTTYFQGNSIIGSDLQVNSNLYIYGTCNPTMTSVANSGTDYVGVQVNTSQGPTYQYPLCIMYGSFTGFHRCFVDDELFNNDEPQTFKDTYIGRIVISTGKIATDTKLNEEWEIKYDKEGITIEDTHPIVQLSRRKKDKKVFGVFGLSSRNNSRTERLIVNALGEGAIWVCNSNGNIENGDYITSSDYLGYGEKQDEIFLCNYTVAKATIDCNFELDSPYYNCFELNENIKIAFIACTYHCG